MPESLPTLARDARRLVVQALSVIALMLGAYVSVGWALGNETMVRVTPNSVPMVFATALMFIVAGIALYLWWAERSPLVVRLCGWFLALLAVGILAEHALDQNLGLDWPALHAQVYNVNPRPGRTSPNACLAFLFVGLTFIFSARQRCRPFAIAAFVIGFAGLLGYALGLEGMYRIAVYNRMALSTAAGLTGLGIGLWLTALKRRPDRAIEPANERVITRTAALLLTIFGVISGLTGFAVLKQGFDAAMADTMLGVTKNNATTIANAIDMGVTFARAIALEPEWRRALVRLSAHPDDAAARRDVQVAAAAALKVGISAVRIMDARGYQVASAGSITHDRAAVALPIASGNGRATLLWDDGFVLETETGLGVGGRAVGSVATEQRLPVMTRLFLQIQNVDRSSDFLLCGRIADDAVCFPTRFYPANMHIPMFVNGRPNLPINRALLGESGAISVTDLRGVEVIAGFAPVGESRLAIVLKTDVIDLYAPVRMRLNVVLGLLVLFVVLGTGLLRAQVQPIARRLLAEQKRMQAVLETSHEAFVELDAQGRITDWNAQAEQTFGWTKTEAVGRSIGDMLAHDGLRDATGIARLLQADDGAMRNRRLDMNAVDRSGREFPVEVSISAVPGDGSHSFSVFLHDISDRKRAESELHHQATHDVLTGLPNRAELMSRLAQATKRAERNRKPMALLFLDLDGFKAINDNYGHDVGDDLLRAFAGRLAHCARKSDTVARLGGDEFTVIVEGLRQTSDAELFADKVLNAMKAPFRFNGQEHRLGASIGIAVYEGGDESADSLLIRADGAMYAAKQGGKNRYRVSQPPAAALTPV